MLLTEFPLKPPKVTIQSSVKHPNIWGSSICASLINSFEWYRSYSPAYTLKSIAIQLLSCFSSEFVEQDYGVFFNLSTYRANPSSHPRLTSDTSNHFTDCERCGFHTPHHLPTLPSATERPEQRDPTASFFDDKDGEQAIQGLHIAEQEAETPKTTLAEMPDEILPMIFSSLSAEDLTHIAQAYPRAQDILKSYDFIRLRELQCFCLKKNFLDVKLGVGVDVTEKGKEGLLRSEFDLLSYEAFHQHGIRTSIQKIYFGYWLPLPISRRYFRSVESNISDSLQIIGSAARFTDTSEFSVICHFLNDIVVTFSKEFERSYDPSAFRTLSTMTRASEKAVESVFAIFHLLLCLATKTSSSIITKANNMVSSFHSGKTSKADCPSLGHLLMATLISDDGLTKSLSTAVIEETILRNVLWMLDGRGANMQELSYLEPSSISEYRLEKTFQASLTSYRLLMFCNLFYKTARTTGKPLAVLRDDLFDTHGAPPHGMAKRMVQDIHQIKSVDMFPKFFHEMGITEPRMLDKTQFTSFLREMVQKSHKLGYSRMPTSQKTAFHLRRTKEPEVEAQKGYRFLIQDDEKLPDGLSFFPKRNQGKKG
ncbi:MAG: hypothetical protein Q9222_003472 [Ikaeria aurantiellina]